MTGTSGKASICCLRYLLQWGMTGTSGKTLGDDGDVREGFNLLPEVPAAVGDDGDVGEDTRGHRGRHSGMTGTSGKASICCLRYLLQWGTTGTSGKTLGDDGDVREGFNLLPEVPAAVGDDGDVGEDTRG